MVSAVAVAVEVATLAVVAAMAVVTRGNIDPVAVSVEVVSRWR